VDRDALRSPNKLDSITLARELTDHFRQQYQRAAAWRAKACDLIKMQTSTNLPLH